MFPLSCPSWLNLTKLWVSCPAAASIHDLYWPTGTCLIRLNHTSTHHLFIRDVCGLHPLWKPFHGSQNHSFIPNVWLSNALIAAFLWLLIYFIWGGSGCLPSCPFVKQWAINLPGGCKQNIHYDCQPFHSKPCMIPLKMCNVVGDEVISAGKCCVSKWSLHGTLLFYGWNATLSPLMSDPDRFLNDSKGRGG